jgi:hypothetical protein
MFTDKKYSKIYFNIIQRAQSRVLLEGMYFEKHHIIPKSLGGSNDSKNIAQLTAREHFICHLLLVKMTEGANKHKMIYAAWQMAHNSIRNKKRDYKVTARQYATLKVDYAKMRKEKPGPRRGVKLSDETKLKCSIAKKGKTTWNKGIPRTDEEKAKMSATRKLKASDPTWNIRPPCSNEKANKIANALKGKKWANNGAERKYVSLTDFQSLITAGWVPGLGKF